MQLLMSLIVWGMARDKDNNILFGKIYPVDSSSTLAI
jgi:hypothetical protein